MIHFTRTTSIAPGKVADAMTFAGEMIEFISATQGQKMQLRLPVGGNPHRLCFYTGYNSLADMEKAQASLMADPKYLSILGKSAALFIPGSTHDDIWRAV
ncbi:MAG: hypothetical protein V4787_26960 [Pseudomonadota bacterium]